MTNESVPSGHEREFELLFLWARSTGTAETNQRVKALIGPEIDWDFLIETAQTHRVLPLVYRTIVRTCPDDVPAEPIKRLRAAFQRNAQRNLSLTAELLKIIDLLEANNIAAITYKGPALAMALYGDVSLRQFSDLDIIIPLSKAEKAIALLNLQGYKPEKQMNTQELPAFTEKEKDISLFCAKTATILELHWGVTTEQSPIQLGRDMLWENLDTVVIGGRALNIHAPEDLLLLLCIHGGKHRWQYLGWLSDVAQLIRIHKELDWRKVIDKASTLGGRRILFLGLFLANDLLGAELPPDVLRQMRSDQILSELSEQVKGWLTSESPVGLGETEHYFVKLREHRGDKLRVAMNQLKHYAGLTSRDRESLPLHGSMSALLYVIRPFRLAREYGLAPFGRFAKALFECVAGNVRTRKSESIRGKSN
jgi:hypothetical protein